MRAWVIAIVLLATPAAWARPGFYIGVGIGAYVEGTGLGPYEGAIVQIESSGKVLVTTGAAPQGQGHATTMAQIAAHELGINVDDITVITGDTGAIPFGIGTFASRIAVNAGNSIALAAREVREKALAIAANLLEANKDDLSGGARTDGCGCAARLHSAARRPARSSGYPLL